MQASPSANSKFISIEIVQNINLWQRFKTENDSVAKKAGKVHKSLLWHGTRGNDPRSIMATDAGLNINYSNDGMWGKGIYFAVNASYSCPAYSHQVPNM